MSLIDQVVKESGWCSRFTKECKATFGNRYELYVDYVNSMYSPDPKTVPPPLSKEDYLNIKI